MILPASCLILLHASSTLLLPPEVRSSRRFGKNSITARAVHLQAQKSEYLGRSGPHEAVHVFLCCRCLI